MSDERPFIKVSDTLADHPKFIALNDDAAAFMIVAIWGYCRHQNTDGRIPKAKAHRITKSANPARCLKAINVGLLEADGDDYLCHDYLDHQQSAVQRQARKDQAKQAGRAGGLAKGKRTANRTATEPLSGSVSGIQAEVEVEVEVEVEQKTSSSGTRKRATAVPDIFPITDAMKVWGREHAPAVADPQGETRQFLDHHRAKGSTFKDWTAAWRTWMGNAQRYATQGRGAGSSPRREFAPKDAWLENM